MFLVSKLFSVATQPLAWVVVLLLGGLLCVPGRRKWGVGLSWAALSVLLLQGWEPVPDAVLRQSKHNTLAPVREAHCNNTLAWCCLAVRWSPPMLGKAMASPALNEAAERMTEPIPLLQHYPHLRLLFTGGEGDLFADGLTESDRTKIFFDSMGVAPQRVIYESASHTTYENAVLSAIVAGVNPAQPWLLLTSASHMPRAMATFRKVGWNVTPYPVDYRTGKHTPSTQYSLAIGAKKWHLALHELIGLLTYRLAGRA